MKCHRQLQEQERNFVTVRGTIPRERALSCVNFRLPDSFVNAYYLKNIITASHTFRIKIFASFLAQEYH